MDTIIFRGLKCNEWWEKWSDTINSVSSAIIRLCVRKNPICPAVKHPNNYYNSMSDSYYIRWNLCVSIVLNLIALDYHKCWIADCKCQETIESYWHKNKYESTSIHFQIFDCFHTNDTIEPNSWTMLVEPISACNGNVYRFTVFSST